MLVHIPNTSCILKAFALDKGCYLLLYFQFQRSTAFVVAGSGSELEALDEQSGLFCFLLPEGFNLQLPQLLHYLPFLCQVSC